ncbi:hypothetical protein [Polaromonas eurypsychrophila]|uniref:hypothetical protein n=1 Tax=Polaromonas eurypsychrophila TaxID=1614635 RepID=UPI0016696994|nr:hypothetical protein [Polaromonas eurypsychrophila]
MNIEIQNLPSPSKLIATMDRHPLGACLFVVALLICTVALVGLAWIWFLAR